MATTTAVDGSVITLAPSRTSQQRPYARSRERVHAATGSGDVAAYVGALRAESDVRVRLRRGVDLLPTLVHGCHHASITTVRDGRLTVRFATDRTGRRADELQDELEEGPALQAARTGHSVVAQDLRTETRWGGWCSAAVEELDVTGAMSVLLVGHARPTATLNLYSDVADGLVTLDLARLHLLAAPLTDALLLEHRRDRLGPAA